MNLIFSHFLHRPLPRRSGCRRATTSLELLVAFTLITAALTGATPLVVAHGRLLKAQRDYRVALDELSNQLESLTALPPAEVVQELSAIATSEFTASRLPGAQLRGQLGEGALGLHVTLELWWDEPNRQAAPVRLTGWLKPQRGPAPAANEEQP